MLIRAIIFDFDGVIADTEHLHRQAWVFLAEQVNGSLPCDFLNRGVGSTNSQLFQELYQFWNGKIDIETIEDLKTNQFKALLHGRDLLIPGVKQALAWFKAQGFPIGLATSSASNEVLTFLEDNQISDSLISLLTLDDVHRPKPHPEVYQRSAENLKTKPENCLVFEDSVIGITAAQQAGCRTVAIRNSFESSQLPKVEATMNNFLELATTIESLKAGGYDFQP